MAGKDEVWSGWVGHPILFLLLLLFLAGFLKRERRRRRIRGRRKEAFMTEDPRRGRSKEEQERGTGALEWDKCSFTFLLEFAPDHKLIT